MLRTDHYIAARCQIAAPAAKLDAPTESRSSVAAGDEHIAARVIHIVAPERQPARHHNGAAVAAVTRVLALSETGSDGHHAARILLIGGGSGDHTNVSAVLLCRLVRSLTARPNRN